MPGYSLDDQYNLCCTLLVLDWLSSGNNAEDTTTEEPTRQCTEEEAAKGCGNTAGELSGLCARCRLGFIYCNSVRISATGV